MKRNKLFDCWKLNSRLIGGFKQFRHGSMAVVGQ